MPSFRARAVSSSNARLSGVCRVRVLLFCLLTPTAWAQTGVPSPHASLDLGPTLAQVAPQGAPFEPGSTPNAPTPDDNGQVIFGVLCLSKTDQCSEAIVLMKAPGGWWVESKVLDLLGGVGNLETKTIEDLQWGKISDSQAKWDEEAQRLVWDRPLVQREEQVIYNARGDALPPTRAGSIPALALHYSATLDDQANATIGTQAVWSRGNTAVFAGGIYSQGNFTRDLWRVEHDDINRRIRYIVGEQILRPSDPLGGAQAIRGIGVARAYDIDPSLATAARPGLHGIIDQPGVIDIFSNGRLVSSTPIQPGPYQWGNLPLGSGSQQIELVFRGADGTRSTLSSSFFYGANRALGQGLTDFAVRAGEPMQASSHQDVAWQGWVRHGVSSHLTLGGRVEGQGEFNNAGMDGTVGFGFGSADLAYSRDHKGEDAWSANVSIARNGFDLQLGRTKLSPDYWFLGNDARVLSGSSRVIDERNGSIGYGTGASSLRANMSDRRSTDGTRTRTAGLIGTWRSSNDWRWFASVDKVFDEGLRPGQFQASMGVAIPFGRARNQEVEVRALQSDLGTGGQVSWNRHHQEIFGWSGNASAFYLPSGEHGLVAGYTRATPVGTLLLSGVSTSVQQFGVATWSGTIIRADDQWFASSPEQGPRAIVRSDSAPGAVVLRENQVVGPVGKRGRIISQLSPYSPASITLDPSSLPLDADTAQLNKTLIAPRSGVVKVDFDTTANGQVEGVLLIGGQPARLGVLTLQDGTVGWVGESGRLWLQGLSAGTYPGTWTNGSEEKRCVVVVEGDPPTIKQASCD